MKSGNLLRVSTEQYREYIKNKVKKPPQNNKRRDSSIAHNIQLKLKLRYLIS